MNLVKNQKALVLTNIENGLETILQEVTNIRTENMLTLQCYGPVISNPYGDIMRSIIIAIYQENVEEIFVVGKQDKENTSVKVLTQIDSMKDKIQTLDYLFQYNKPEFSGVSVKEWLYGKENENASDNIKKCVNIIQHHPLVPSHVKVKGIIVSNDDGKPIIGEIPTNITVSSLT
ncbi:carbonic anhydrase [Heyndrickxia sp. FSL W8-0423]|uniref:carbonic anhydrase n=1 Tax=Heyndrickxia sp. FSL W8-0423 TaxID=2921601 RepID=UPI0030FCCAFA